MGLNIVPVRPASPSPEPPACRLPSLSIITPALNRAEWIEAAIRSVIAQGYPALQHIVVDGGSTDGTLERLARFPGLTVLGGPDKNSHDAMNKGLRAATGEIVGFLNTDDLYPPGALAAVGRRFAAEPGLVAVCGRCLLAEPGQPPDQELLHDPDEPWGEILFGAPGFNSWFFRRERLLDLGGVDDRYVIAADRDLVIRMALKGWRPTTIGQPVYVYHRHAGSATLDQDGRQAEALLGEHVEIGLRLRRAAGAEDRRRLDAFLAFEALQLAIRRGRAGQWGLLLELVWRLGGWLPRWPAALLRARRWRRRLKRAWRQP